VCRGAAGDASGYAERAKEAAEAARAAVERARASLGDAEISAGDYFGGGKGGCVRTGIDHSVTLIACSPASHFPAVPITCYAHRSIRVDNNHQCTHPHKHTRTHKHTIALTGAEVEAREAAGTADEARGAASEAASKAEVAKLAAEVAAREAEKFSTVDSLPPDAAVSVGFCVCLCVSACDSVHTCCTCSSYTYMLLSDHSQGSASRCLGNEPPLIAPMKHIVVCVCAIGEQ
jgi:hypothetical protein